MFLAVDEGVPANNRRDSVGDQTNALVLPLSVHCHVNYMARGNATDKCHFYRGLRTSASDNAYSGSRKISDIVRLAPV
ncbi:hypothetical protein GCM10010052_42610 [Paenarthrobacter histidinolovorans]|nr:hypothetical protein GCM10010052_42610 [Paenarthrobacter histidinolovorans]